MAASPKNTPDLLSQVKTRNSANTMSPIERRCLVVDILADGLIKILGPQTKTIIKETEMNNG
jgi:hypothetical protein